MSTTPTERCTKCSLSIGEVKSCSRCKGPNAAKYCSKECQKAHWAIHKPICKPYRTDEVWGIKILYNDAVPGSDVHDGDVSKRFQHVLLKTSHAIFKKGEMCPVPGKIGVPLVIWSEALMGTGLRAPENQAAVYLRIEPHNAFAPIHWQMNGAGDCLILRRDKRPLTRETIEVVFKFCAKMINGADYPESDGWAPIGELATPAAFQMFSRDYYAQQKAKGREGFDRFFVPL
ncbi:hypothetical protein JAAARDRAFT_32798 [Jaapia argillacea MUCL 33604]|uniref:MYND-type domain-containing protein n=1 Tax=Jaapia argillacea MUCL 33604 TaxID=933084 RepID=A0A067QCU6_9AGAM|nr:hypothetical protein JAAARDRAFT_32798 [Jaapia argillacea MUCL 33604]